MLLSPFIVELHLVAHPVGSSAGLVKPLVRLGPFWIVLVENGSEES